MKWGKRGKVVIASDSFKGSLTSREVGEAAARGVQKARQEADCEVVAVADGGEGTVEAIVSARKGRLIDVQVDDPLGRPILATYGICSQQHNEPKESELAVIEVAAASGLPLLAATERNPWLTSSRGTGEVIRDALLRGCRRFMVGLGGSATNDAGLGMLQALGYRFLDADGKEVGEGGGETGRVVTIDCSQAMQELKEAKFTVACDVTNPLTGAQGASRVFGPQKGADAEMVEKLDKNLASFAAVTEKFLHSSGLYKQEKMDFANRPGAGAAGGLGFAFLAFLGAEMKPGIEMVLDAVGFAERLEGASLVITGEGRLDRQTCMGKTPYGVLKYAQRAGMPTIAIGGAVEEEAVEGLLAAGFEAVFPIVAGPCSLERALQPEVAKSNVERTAEMIIRLCYGSR